jgi:hypothetical protein
MPLKATAAMRGSPSPWKVLARMPTQATVKERSERYSVRLSLPGADTVMVEQQWGEFGAQPSEEAAMRRRRQWAWACRDDVERWPRNFFFFWGQAKNTRHWREGKGQDRNIRVQAWVEIQPLEPEAVRVPLEGKGKKGQ